MGWVTALANLLKFANAIVRLVQSHRDYGAGWAAAVAQALTTAAAQTRAAKEELDSATRAHASDDTDSAFLQEYRRD